MESAKATPENWTPYAVQAQNHSEQSENKMHSDDVARSYGFAGALVSGVAVLSHMTRPLVDRFGEDWFTRGTASGRLFKPAYHGDLVTVRTEQAPGTTAERSLLVRAFNDAGERLAEITTELPDALPEPDPRWRTLPDPRPTERQDVHWDLIQVGQPYRAFSWKPTREDNLTWCEMVQDDLPLYREGDTPPIHPGFIFKQCNNAFRNQFLLKAWIHVSSRIIFHRALRVGESVEVRVVPEEKWEKKGHQFARMYMAFVAGGEPVAEVWHDGIFRVAPAR